MVGGTAVVLEQLTAQEWERIHALAVAADDASKVQLSGIPHDGDVAYALAQSSGTRYLLRMWEEAAQNRGLPHLPKALRVVQRVDKTLVEIAESDANGVLRFREQLPDGVGPDNLPKELVVGYTLPSFGLPQRLTSLSFSNGTLAQVVFNTNIASPAAAPSPVKEQQVALPTAAAPPQLYPQPVSYFSRLPEDYRAARIGPGAAADALGLKSKIRPSLGSSEIFSGVTRARSASLGDVVVLAEKNGWLTPDKPEVFDALVAAAKLPKLVIEASALQHPEDALPPQFPPVATAAPAAAPQVQQTAPPAQSPAYSPPPVASPKTSPLIAAEMQRALHKNGPFSLYIVAYGQAFREEGIFAGLKSVLVHNPLDGTYLAELRKLSEAPSGPETYIFNPEKFELGVAVEFWTTQNQKAPRVIMTLKSGEKKFILLRPPVEKHPIIWNVPDSQEVYLGLEDSISIYDETRELISGLAKSESAGKVLEYAHRRMPGKNESSLELLAAMLGDNKPRLIDPNDKSLYEQRIALDALSILALTTRVVDDQVIRYELNSPFLASIGYALEHKVGNPTKRRTDPHPANGATGASPGASNGPGFNLGALPEGVNPDLARRVYNFAVLSGEAFDNSDLESFAGREEAGLQEVIDIVGVLVRKGIVNETDPVLGIYQVAKPPAQAGLKTV